MPLENNINNDEDHNNLLLLMLLSRYGDQGRYENQVL